jgi:hypothetical protein
MMEAATMPTVCLRFRFEEHPKIRALMEACADIDHPDHLIGPHGLPPPLEISRAFARLPAAWPPRRTEAGREDLFPPSLDYWGTLAGF